MIRIVKACEREIRAFPREAREGLADALARLDEGQKLSMPLSRPMPVIGRGVHELRLRDRGGIFRVVYALIERDQVLVVHAFQKKTQKTPLSVVELVRARIRQEMQ